jgi:zinc transporter 5/7
MEKFETITGRITVNLIYYCQFEHIGLLLGGLFLFVLSFTGEQMPFSRTELLFQLHSIRLDGILSHTWGLVMLIVAIICNILRKNHARRLAADLGDIKLFGFQLGYRRIFWISIVLGAVLQIPIIMIQFVLNPRKIFFELISLRNIILLVMGNLLITFPYYADRITKRNSKNQSSSLSPADDSAPITKSPPLQWRMILTCILCMVKFYQPTTFILAGMLFIKSVTTLTGQPNIINTTLPFSLGQTNKRTSKSKVMNGIVMYLQFIMANKDSRYLFFFLLANLAFMVVELIYGLISNSLGLISDSAHMFFDCGALAIGLYGSFMSKWKSNNVYTYGYGRYEYISALVNGLLLVFISIYIFLEAFHRIFDPPVIDSTARLILISVLGFFINLTGMFFFHQDESDEKHNENMYGVYLHMLADTLGSVSVIISTAVMQYFGWYMADPICSLLISVMILGASYPLLSNSASVLMQRSPQSSDAKILSCLETIEHMQGILSVSNTHFWTMDNSTVVGTLHVKVEDQINEQQMRQRICDILGQCGVNSITVQIEKSEIGYIPPVMTKT